MRTPVAQPAVSDIVRAFEPVRRLGASPTSEVMLAVARGPLGFERNVALKRIAVAVAPDARARADARLSREALAYARLAHPAIVRLLDFFDDRGRLTLVLEHVDGVPLDRAVAQLRARGEALDDAASLYVGYRVFSALAAAHSARDPITHEFSPIIHRAVCPANILLPWDGYAKLADFGAARLAGVPGDTQPGEVRGSLGYLAPEQARGEPVSVRTDVYAGCLILRELLLRTIAFPAEGAGEKELHARMAWPELAPVDVARPELPARLARALERGLSRDVERRDLTADEMASLLKELVDVETGRLALVAHLRAVRRADEGSHTTPTMPDTSGDDTESTAPQVAFDAAATTERRALDPEDDTVATAQHERIPSGQETLPLGTPTLVEEPEPAAPPTSAIVRTVPRVAPAPPKPPPFLAPRPFAPLTPVAFETPSEGARAVGVRRSRLVLAIALAAITSGLVIGGGLGFGERLQKKQVVLVANAPRPRPRVGGVGGTTPNAMAPPNVAPPPPALQAPKVDAPKTTATTGAILTEAREAGHRLFVDGRFAGSAGAPVIVRCGFHEVRVGSAGRARKVLIPCGGAVEVSR